MKSLFCTRFVPLLAMLTCLLTLAASVSAQPTLKQISPLGLQIGGTTRVALSGSGFDETLRFFLVDGSDTECAIEIHSVSDNSADLSISLESQLDNGLNGIRVVTRGGISNVAWVCLDDGVPLAIQKSQGIETTAQLPLALNGRISGDQIIRVPFLANEGEVVVTQAWAKRLGSALRPVVRVLDPNDKQLAWQAPQPQLDQDTTLVWRVPSTGTYQLELHDATYRAPENSIFHVSVSTSPMGDSIFPFSGKLGTDYRGRVQTRYSVMGVSQQRSSPSRWLDPRLPQQVTLEIPAKFSGWYRAPNRFDSITTQGTPRLWIDALPEYYESDHEADEMQVIAQISAPMQIHGTLTEGETVDQYQIKVTPGQKLRCEVWAARMGSRLDGVLVVRDPGGKELGRSDDRPGTSDPEVVLTVPPNTDSLILHLTDLTRSAGDLYQYRIAVDDVSTGEFQARLTDDRVTTFGTNFAAIPILIDRQGYQGSLGFKAIDLPPGWEAEALPISGSANQGLVRVRRIADNVKPGTLTLVCYSTTDPNHGTFASFSVPLPVQHQSPWLSRALGVASTDAPGLNLELPSSLSQKAIVYAGGEFTISCKLNAGDELPADAMFRIRLLTSQQPLKKKIKVNNQDQEVEDLERTIHLVGDTVVTDALTDARIAIPADLPIDYWQCALIVEAMQSDGSVVYSRASSTPFEIHVHRAFTLDTKGLETPIDVTAGESFTVSGTIQRIEPFSAVTKLEVRGLPEGWTCKSQNIEADSDSFELTIQIPPSQAAGEVNTIRLHATAFNDIESHNPSKVAAIVPRAIKVNVKAAHQK